MSQETTIVANPHRELIVAGLKVVRSDALKEGSIDDAVNHAILGTIVAVENGLRLAGEEAPLLVDLTKEIEASWVEEVNS